MALVLAPVLYDVRGLVPSTIWPAAISVSFILNSQERESDGCYSSAWLAVFESDVCLRSSCLWQRRVRLHSSLPHQLGLLVLTSWLLGKELGKLSNICAASWFYLTWIFIPNANPLLDCSVSFRPHISRLLVSRDTSAFLPLLWLTFQMLFMSTPGAVHTLSSDSLSSYQFCPRSQSLNPHFW